MNIEKLFEARKKRGYSQEDLANICGVSRQAVSKWESGQSIPDAENLLQISKALEISIDYLLDNEDMSEQKVKVRIDLDDLMEQENKHTSYEYVSKTKIFGVPLVHINRSKFNMMNTYGVYRRRNLKVAKGIIAIGDISIGIISIGLFSMGLFSLGIFGLSLLGLGILQAGFYSFGIISVGFSSFGVIAIGIYSTGVVAIAYQTAIGVAAVGKHAIGMSTVGSSFEVAIQKSAKNFCSLSSHVIEETKNTFNNQWMPFPQRLIYFLITKC